MRIEDLSEYETRLMRGVSLSRGDRQLCDRLSKSDQTRLRITELREGIEVQASQWVGVARFDTFEVNVRPKLIGGEKVLVEMLDYATDDRALKRFGARRSFARDQENLLEIFIRLFVSDCEHLIRLGLLTDYVEREDDLRFVRGRILFDRQVMDRFGQVDRVLCRFDEREQNILENQLLSYTLGLCDKLTRNVTTKRSLRRLLRTFRNVCDDSAVDLRAVRRDLTYTRLNDHYRPAHQLAWTVIDALGIDDFFSSAERTHHAFFIEMNVLFERFVERLVGDVLPSRSVRVLTQLTDGSVIRDATSRKKYRNIRPDALIEAAGGDVRLPIDAKYKLYEEKGIATSDVYQLYFYGRTYNEHDPAALLLYPARVTRVDNLAIFDARGEQMGRLAAFGIDVQEFFSDSRPALLSRLRETLFRINPRLEPHASTSSKRPMLQEGRPVPQTNWGKILDLIDEKWRPTLELLEANGIPPATGVHRPLMSRGLTTPYEVIAVWEEARRRIALVTREIASAAVGNCDEILFVVEDENFLDALSASLSQNA